MKKKEKCRIYAEMHLVFDSDFDVYSITHKLGLEPTDCKLRNETTISPLTNKQIEGYWNIKTEEKEEADLKIILDDLLGIIKDKIKLIKEICDENDGIVIFDIVSFFDATNKPALYFERDFLDIVDYLNATIDIDIYLN